MVGAGEETFVSRFSRTQENAFPDGFQRIFVFLPQIFFRSAEKWAAMAHPLLPPVAWPLYKGERMRNYPIADTKLAQK